MDRPTIWIDVTDFLSWRGNFTGIQRFQYNIIQQYIANGQRVGFFVYTPQSHSFSQIDFKPDKIVKDGIIKETPGANYISNQQGDIPFHKGDKVLMLSGIWYDSFAEDLHKAKRDRKFLFIPVVHDMIPIVHPELIYDPLNKIFPGTRKKLFKAADALLANSEWTKKDTKNFMNKHGISPKPIGVIRIGEDLIPNRVSYGGRSKGFILSVGAADVRKNPTLIYYVYKEACRRNIKLPRIVIVGKPGFNVDNVYHLIKYDKDIKDKFQILENISDSRLSWLYSNCLFTIYPSIYEGWGIPIAESLSHGKLCLASNSSSMPEVAGDLIEYFSPFDTNKCLELINKYLNPETLSRKERQIKRTYTPTTWQQTYQSIQDFISNL